ncbi:ankyrin repeat domain-containing protein [Cardinium endosymbiont of Bemisia tabaci]|uniref:ankyrin repeat domain-containing protein n=1 Tax=Cardinium endosymbiont of Bemisia tabaci TaxID=672794 RepID=UPI000554C3CF|nr:ankyrin repeat domain-containing protein [Cardinium endosymbiont of Bemisia tabaci]
MFGSDGRSIAENSKCNYQFIADILKDHGLIAGEHHIVAYLYDELDAITEKYFEMGSDPNSQPLLVEELNSLVRCIQNIFKEKKCKILEELAKKTYYPIISGYHKPSIKDSGKTQPLLIHAVNIGDVKMVDILFKFFWDAIPDKYDAIFAQKFGPAAYTIIHQAVANGNFEMLEYLITKYIAIKKASGSSQDKAYLDLKNILNIKNGAGQSPVAMALAECVVIENQYALEICQYLLSCVGLWFENNDFEKKQVMSAFKNICDYSFDMFKSIIQSLPPNCLSNEETIKKIVNSSDEHHDTLLSLLVEKSCKEGTSKKEISYLINLGADCTSFNKSGVSPIVAAIKHNDLDTLKLLPLKSNINKKNKYGATPLHYASGYKRFQLPHTISPSPETRTNQTSIVKHLLDQGADHSIKNNVGDTPTHQAIKSNTNDILMVLLENGADALTPNKEGKTALDLLAYNIPMSCSTLRYGVTPLHSKQEESMRLLAEVLGKDIISKKSVHAQSEYKKWEQSISLYKTINTVYKDGPRHKDLFINNINVQLDREFGLKLTVPPSTCKKRKYSPNTSLVSTKKRKCKDGSSSGKTQGI